MSGFYYYGFSTKNILDEPLVLVNAGSNDISSIKGSNRVLHGSDVTISRNYKNEYGTIKDLLNFTYSLIKQNHEPFNTEEQILIEEWLTTPKKSSLLEVFDCDDNIRYKFLGLFTNTNWQVPSYNDGFSICTFTFTVNGSYPFEHYKETFINTEESALWRLDVPESLYQEDIYPVIKVTPNSGEYLPHNFQISNANNRNEIMEFTIPECEGLKIDCKKCMITAIDEENQNNAPSLSFKNFGWEDIDNIYWLKIHQGQNLILISGDDPIDIQLEYDVPVRKVGGWLI